MAVPLVLVVLPLGLLFLLSGLIINAIQVRPNPQLDWWRNLFFFCSSLVYLRRSDAAVGARFGFFFFLFSVCANHFVDCL
jgi:hypothetical protein